MSLRSAREHATIANRVTEPRPLGGSIPWLERASQSERSDSSASRGVLTRASRLLWLVPALLAAAAPESEHLRYQVNWPSGLALGEAQLRIVNQQGRTESEFSIDASVPGFQVLDKFHAIAGGDLCSLEFEKNSMHGKKASKEITTFEPARGVAIRKTNGGGSSELEVGACGHDALTFLSFVRQELIKGRVPGPQSILFGGQYQIRMQHKGAEMVQMPDGAVEADRLAGAVKTSIGEVVFEMYFARDRTRTPVLIKLPLAMGTFSMELIR